jgi:hypothetical protein
MRLEKWGGVMQNFVGLFACALLAASPAAAEISYVAFAGDGTVTYSDYAFAPAVGTPVLVNGWIDFGDQALPDRFTGSVGFNNVSGVSYFFNVVGGQVSGDGNGPYGGVSAQFLRGRLTAVSMYADYDSSIYDLYNHSFRGTVGFHSNTGEIFSWGGKWSLVPEPGSWATLLIGFALTGTAMRRRTRATA